MHIGAASAACGAIAIMTNAAPVAANNPRIAYTSSMQHSQGKGLVAALNYTETLRFACSSHCVTERKTNSEIFGV
jgi:hypothetical protein